MGYDEIPSIVYKNRLYQNICICIILAKKNSLVQKDLQSTQKTLSHTAVYQLHLFCVQNLAIVL